MAVFNNTNDTTSPSRTSCPSLSSSQLRQQQIQNSHHHLQNQHNFFPYYHNNNTYSRQVSSSRFATAYYTIATTMDAGRLYKTVCTSLGGDPEKAVKTITSPYDAVAIVVHAWALHSGLTYDGFSEDNDNNNTSKRADAFGLIDIKPLEQTWQRGSPHFFSFRYSKNGLPIDITISRLGGQGMISVHGLLGKVNANCNVNVNEVTNKQFFSHPDGTEEVRDAYSSDENVEKLCNQLTTGILKTLIPDDKATAAGVASSSSPQSKASSSNQQQQKPQLQEQKQQQLSPSKYSRSSTPSESASRPFTPVPTTGGHNPQPPERIPDGPPGFEDEFELQARPPSANAQPFAQPYGDQDLYPPGIGRNPPLQPMMGIPPGGPGVGGPGTGGMHPTFDDPLFQNIGGNQRHDHNNMMRPPGARWDPTGPNDSRFGPGSGPNFI